MDGGEDEDDDDHLEQVKLLPHDRIHLLSDLILHLQSLLTPERYHHDHWSGHQSPIICFVIFVLHHHYQECLSV